jgi:hypothetical protein
VDHDTENNLCFHATDATCQVCSFYRDFQNETLEEMQTELNEWCLHVIDVTFDPKKPPAQVSVMCCPACAELDREKILEGYKLRIRRGDDFRYH